MSDIVISVKERVKIFKHIVHALNKQPQMNKYQLKESLLAEDMNYSTSAINSILYSNRSIFSKSDNNPPLWKLTSHATDLFKNLLVPSETIYSSSLKLK
jgi:hypothetical protein